MERVGAPVAAAGFPPIADSEIETLILGSLPSQQSLATRQYYGNPRNAFWPIMGELIDAGPAVPYADRTARLLADGIGVWDVLSAAVRPGSLDANIDVTTAAANDFHRFFNEHPSVARVFFNGRKAADLFRRFGCAEMIRRNDIDYETLPSTSPAFAAMPFSEKVTRWVIVKPTAVR